MAESSSKGSHTFIRALGLRSAEFNDSLTERFSRDIGLISVILFLATFVVFGYLTPNAFINGDAAVYSQQVLYRDFSSRTIHIGYYLLGYLFTFLTPNSTDLGLNLMNCFLGGLSAALISLIAYSITEDRLVALVSGIFFSTNYILIENSLYAEVYLPQTFFFLLAVEFWLRNKPIPSGLSFAFSFLIMPSTIFSFPFFVILRPNRRDLLRFVLTTSIVVATVLFPNYQDYFFGGRGLLKAANESMSVSTAVFKEGMELFYGFFLYIPLLIIGFLRLVQDKQLIIWGGAIFVLWLVSFFLGERFEDVPVQLPTYALLCTVAGLGFGAVVNSPYTKIRLIRWIPYISSILLGFVLLFIRFNLVKLPVFFPPSYTMLIMFLAAIFLFAVMELVQGKRIGKGIYNLLICYLAFLIVIGMNFSIALKNIQNTTNSLVFYRDTVLEMNKVAKPNYIVVGDWNPGILFEHYVFGQSYTGRWINIEDLSGDRGKNAQLESTANLREAMIAGREIWVLGRLPTMFADLHSNGYRVESFRDIFRAERDDR